MEKLSSSFWKSIQSITGLDRSIEVPQESVQNVLDIFQVEKRSALSHVFSLVPSFTGAVRRAENASKFLYQITPECMVQLEKTGEPDGIHLTGFVHGLEDGAVTIIGDEYSQDSQSRDGLFEFENLPCGEYNLAIESEGEIFWIRSLDLGEDN